MNLELRRQIKIVLQSIATNSPVLTNPPATEKLYEIFVFSCAIKALSDIGAILEPRDNSSSYTSRLIFRLGPGLIYSPSSSPGYVNVVYGTNEFELHNDLRVIGRSGVLHELDICLLNKPEAERCRNNSINPSQARVKFLAECKFYGSELPLNLGREFLGLSQEFSLRVKTIVSNSTSSNIHRVVTRHKGTVNFDISPLKQNNVDMFVQWLATEFKQVLR